MTKKRILILAHDLTDAAINNRAHMLKIGGAEVIIAGFSRGKVSENPYAESVVQFGTTYNGNFIQRIICLAKLIISIKRHKPLFNATDIIIARNLEMLAVASYAKRYLKKEAIIVYECLDIHRLLLGKGVSGKILRKLEGHYARSASLLITSSQAFLDNYFNLLSEVRLPVRIQENKLLGAGLSSIHKSRAIEAAWTIGWFGILRCKKSLRLLSSLTQQLGGRVNIIIRGKPALDQMSDFFEVVDSNPFLNYGGAYLKSDLEKMYSEVHFSWAIDMYEEGQNSSWLLPNRIYEGGAFGAVPIALRYVNTGKFLEKIGVGVLLSENIMADLELFFAQLNGDTFRALENQISGVPKDVWSYSESDCIDLVQSLENLLAGEGEKRCLDRSMYL